MAFLNVLGKSNVVLGLGAIITVSVAAYLFTHPEELEKVIESLKGTKPQKTKEPENSSIPSHKALNNKSIQIIDNLKRGEIKKIKKEFVNDHINNVQDLEEKVIKAQELLKTFNIKNPENPIEVIKSTNTNDKNINPKASKRLSPFILNMAVRKIPPVIIENSIILLCCFCISDISLARILYSSTKTNTFLSSTLFLEFAFSDFLAYF